MVPAAHLQGVARSEQGADPVDAVGLRSGDGDEARDPDPAPQVQACLPRKIRERREGVGDLDVRPGSRDRARLRGGGQVDPHEGFRIQREAEARHVHGDEGRLVGGPLELIAEGDGVPVDLEPGVQPGPDPRRDVHLARFAGTLVGRGRSRRGFACGGGALRLAFGRDRRRDRARGQENGEQGCPYRRIHIVFLLREAAQPPRLLRYAFDGVRTESRILFADFPEFLELLRIAPGLKFFDAVPNLHDDAPFWRLSLKHSDFSSLNKGAAAGRLGPGRSTRDVVLRVSRRVRYVDLHDVVDGRLGLGVKAFDGYGAESETGDDGQRYCVPGFHACILLV